ncbi:MAG: MerR family transcriptional regulator [Bauldia sp.]
MSKGPDAFRTISEVAEDLNLPQHVLRFWETRFAQIKPMKRGGGRRYYRPDDIDLLRGIRHLLYGEGYTIKGVQRILKEQGSRFVIGAGRGESVALSGIPRGESAELLEDEIASSGYQSDDGDERHFGENGGAVVENGDHAPHGEGENGGAFGHARRFVGRLMQEEHGAVGDGPGGGPLLAGDEVQQLQATLSELLEMKRLLDQAR